MPAQTVISGTAYAPRRIGRSIPLRSLLARRGSTTKYRASGQAVLADSPTGDQRHELPGAARAFGRVCNFHTGYAKTSRPSEIRLRRRHSRTKEIFAADLCRSEPIAILCCTAADRFLPVLRHLPSAPRPGMQSVAARSYPGFSPVAL